MDFKDEIENYHYLNEALKHINTDLVKREIVLSGLVVNTQKWSKDYY